MNVLITGALGFSGRKLSEALSKKTSFKIFTSDIHSNSNSDNYNCCDLRDFKCASEIILKTKPDLICHLAGTFSNDYEIDYSANVLATKNILENIKTLGKNCRIMLIGSSAEYGVVEKDESPIIESRALRPTSVYGLTKVYQTYLMQYYFNAFNLDIVMARAFNIFGKGISDKLFIGRVYQQIQQLKNNEIKKIIVGNLDNERDYISIEEAIKHYIKILLHGKKGEIYNVGNGVPVKTRVILNKVLDEENIDIKYVETAKSERDNTYDVPQIYADTSKLRGLMENE
jgi:GDP-4-dehydro-6-deoxy-D-mannose reductase